MISKEIDINDTNATWSFYGATNAMILNPSLVYDPALRT